MNGGGSCQLIPIFIWGKQKDLISEEIKPFIMRLVEISGIEPLSF